MRIKLLSVLLLAQVLTRDVGASINLDVSPVNISPGLTPSLTINCKFSLQDLPNVSNIMSIFLLRTDFQSNTADSFVEVTSVSAVQPNQATALVDLNASVSGQILKDGESFLSLHWEYPSEVAGGVYRCDVNVVDKLGHPDVVTASAQVIVSTPELSDLLQTVETLKAELESQRKRQADLMAANFYVSSEYNGSIYLASKHYTVNIDVAEVSCEHYGGYLAELDDAAEHAFLKSFLNPLRSINYVMLGATDEAEEETWVFRFSGNPMVYTDWYGNEPNYPNNDCMYLNRQYSWKMYDFPCYKLDVNYIHFVCEVPQQ